MSFAIPLEGYVHPAFVPVARVFARQIRIFGGGGAVSLWHRGHCVVDLWGGDRDEVGNPWRSDTIVASNSTTKGVAATALHVAADRGLIDYDAPVARYWPEFAQAGKEAITVRQVLCHEAGLYHVRDMVDHPRQLQDWDHMIDALARSAPRHEPGTANGYHAFTFGHLVGEIVQRVTGANFSDFVQEVLAEPLGLDGLYIGAPEEALHRAAAIVRPAQKRANPHDGMGLSTVALTRLVHTLSKVLSRVPAPLNFRATRDGFTMAAMEELSLSSHDYLRACIPALNGLFSARSLAKLYAALAAGGTLDGTRLLSEETLRKATTVQNRRMDLVTPVAMQWRLGYHMVPTTRGVLRHGFGHTGYGGSGAWADPSRDLSVGLVLNGGLGTGVSELRIMEVGAAAIEGARARRAGPLPTSIRTDALAEAAATA